MGVNIELLKALAIGMGVLIVAGLAVIVVTVVNRLGAPGAAPETVAVRLPEGAEIVETALDGPRLALRLQTPDGPRVAFFDLATGALLQTVEIVEIAR